MKEHSVSLSNVESGIMKYERFINNLVCMKIDMIENYYRMRGIKDMERIEISYENL